jgi:translation initiation factor 2 alpha subunit (eIF-2alpha)
VSRKPENLETDVYDATKISSSKFVSINDLMKKKNQGMSNTIDVNEKDGYSTLQAKRLDSKENKKRILNFLAIGCADEDEIIKKVENIKPTDDSTMNKILNFASDVNMRLYGKDTLEESPMNRRNKANSSQLTIQKDNEEQNSMYKTLNDDVRSQKSFEGR